MTLIATIIVIAAIVVPLIAFGLILFLYLKNAELEAELDQQKRANAKLAEYIRTKDSDSWARTPIRSHANRSTAVRPAGHKPASHRAPEHVDMSETITTGAITPLMEAAGIDKIFRTVQDGIEEEEPREQQPETDSVRMMPHTSGRITTLIPIAA